MKLTGIVINRFRHEGKIYAPTGTVDFEEYTGKKITYPDTITLDQAEYERIEKMGLISHGKIVEEKKKSKIDKEEE